MLVIPFADEIAPGLSDIRHISSDRIDLNF